MAERQDGKIIERDIEEEMKTAYIDYAMSVIVARALPDVRDGLKPVHRRILYTMHEDGLTPDKPYRKSATTVGDVLGRYHPHGDASVYDALVRLAQDFSMRYMLVDGHGNFGSIDGDPPAAYRYTEARMSKIAEVMLTDIEKNTVDFMPNFDDRLQEPTVLPAQIPALLVNGSSGIAVGMATNIPPHNLTEVINGLIKIIDEDEVSDEDLMEIIKGPDFPTEGLILGIEGIKEAYKTGRGKITLRAEAEIEEMNNNRQKIVIRSLPYQVNKAKLIENMAHLVREKRLEGISEIRDESDREERVRVVVELKKDANAQVVLNQLYKHTQMQTSFGIIMLALVNGVPQILTLRQCLDYYLEHRKDVTLRRTKFELDKALARVHILEGLRIAIDNIDEVINIIRSAYDDAKEKLMERFKLSDIQAQAILDMRLKTLSGLQREKIEEEYNELMKLIAHLKEILASETLVYGIIKEELLEIKEKFGDDRKTKIVAAEGEFEVEDLIKEEQSVIALTHFGYIKRMPIDTYKSQKRGGKGITGITTKEDDFVVNIRGCDKKLIIRGKKREFDNDKYFKASLSIILGNMFKTKKIVEELKREKYLDSSLKVYNRRAYDELLQGIKKKYQNIGVLFVDANGLGILNNMYGYQKGDKLLKVVSSSLKKNFRQSDIYRIGGDEFVVICPSVVKEQFERKMLSSKASIEQTEFTASFGMVYKEETDDLESAVEEASFLMKRNKEAFRELHPEIYLDKYKVKQIIK